MELAEAGLGRNQPQEIPSLQFIDRAKKQTNKKRLKETKRPNNLLAELKGGI